MLQPVLSEQLNKSSSNLFIVPEETEFETYNSTADEQKAAKSSPKCFKELIFSKGNHVKSQTPGAKILPPIVSGIGRGLRKTLSKKKLQPVVNITAGTGIVPS